MVAKILYMGEYVLDDGAQLTIKSNMDFLNNLKSKQDPGAKNTLFDLPPQAGTGPKASNSPQQEHESQLLTIKDLAQLPPSPSSQPPLE